LSSGRNGKKKRRTGKTVGAARPACGGRDREKKDRPGIGLVCPIEVVGLEIDVEQPVVFRGKSK